MTIVAYENPNDGVKLRRLVPQLERDTGVDIEFVDSLKALRKSLTHKPRRDVVLVVRNTPEGLRTAAKTSEESRVRVVPIDASATYVTVMAILHAYGYGSAANIPPGNDNTELATKKATPAPVPVAETAEALPVLEHAVRELHSPESGRLDASRIAALLGIKLPRFAEMLGRKYHGVRKTPDSETLQKKLQPYARIAQAAAVLIKDTHSFRVWLNAPNPDLDNLTPLSVMASGKPEVVMGMLEDALGGHPS